MRKLTFLNYKLLGALLGIALLMSLSMPNVTLAEGKTESSQLQIETVLGNGDYDDISGKPLESSFRSPQGILMKKDGTLLISDTLNYRIKQFNGNAVSNFAGFDLLEIDEEGNPIAALIDGDKKTAVFNYPLGLAEDSQGNVYVADSENHAIRIITLTGEVKTLAGNGVAGLKDGKGNEARFNRPSDVVVGKSGDIFVADTLNHVIRKISPTGTVTTLNAPSERVVEVVGGYVIPTGDFQDGPLKDAKFNEPSSLAVDKKGNLYVADTGNQVIRYIDFSTNTVSTVAGPSPVEYEKNALYAEAGFKDDMASKALFNFPKGIAITDEGALIIADSLNHAIRVVKDGKVTTLAGNGQKGDVEGELGKNQLHFPTDVAILGNGNILVADTYNNKIRTIAKVEKKTDEGADKFTHYIVKKGDWLSKIAREYNTTWQYLQEINQLPNPHHILPGKMLLVPKK